jgi:hypothetical protein
VLGSRVLHADETPIALLDPGGGKTRKAYMWAYARGAFDRHPGVIYDFCVGRGSKHPFEFLKGWSGTLVRDEYSGYDAALLLDGRTGAGCMAHARRKFDELVKANASEVAQAAIQRIAWLYRIEAEARGLSSGERLQMRNDRSRPLCDEFHGWLQLERRRVPDGSATAKAIDYSLNHWKALTDAIPRRWRSAHPQQPHRKPDAAMGNGQEGLAVRRQRTGGRASSGRHEPAAVGQAPGPQSLGVPQGRADAIADADEQPHRGAAAPLLAATRLRRPTRRAERAAAGVRQCAG